MAGRRDGLRELARRRYWREPAARVLVEAWRGSGESLGHFAKRYGLKRARLARWAERLQRPAAPVLHPVRLVRPGAEMGGGIELQLPDGTRVFVPPGFVMDDLRRVLAVLSEPVSC
jgi:hypothetical protein